MSVREAVIGALLAGSGALEPHFQPLRSTRGAPQRFEVLARIRGNSGQLLNPGEVFDQVQALSLQRQLDLVVLQAVVDKAARGLVRAGSVNLFSQSLFDPKVEQLLHRLSGLGDWGVELLETDLVVSSKQLLPKLQQLDSWGLALCVDDFGTGASLANLASFADLISVVKLDRVLVLLAEGPRTAGVVRALVHSLRSAGFCIVVEGIETPEQAATFEAMGVDWLQGWFVGKPGPLPGAETPTLEAPLSFVKV